MAPSPWPSRPAPCRPTPSTPCPSPPCPSPRCLEPPCPSPPCPPLPASPGAASSGSTVACIRLSLASPGSHYPDICGVSGRRFLIWQVHKSEEEVIDLPDGVDEMLEIHWLADVRVGVQRGAAQNVLLG